MRLDRNTALFVVLCLIWGSTWLALKVGVATTPPLLFAATRFMAAGVILLGVLLARRERLSPRSSDLPRLMLVTVLMVTACYGLLFWGARLVSSGLAGVLEMSLTPISLLGFALLSGDEDFDPARAAAIALGVAGLLLVFIPAIQASGGGRSVAGGAAVSLAAVCYAAGAVMSRRLMHRYSSLYLAAFTMTVGGVLLLGLFFVLEPHAPQMLVQPWRAPAIEGWSFLVIAGSLTGYSIYMHLLRVWGASRSGAYAFPSCVVAVLTGHFALGEKVSPTALVGMAVLLAAAGLAIRPRRESRLQTGQGG